jgi:methionine synthase I (cobalamin-dependent)
MLMAAGLLPLVGNQTAYDTSPQEMADFIRRFVEIGVKIVGGCCGSTSAQLTTIAEAVR